MFRAKPKSANRAAEGIAAAYFVVPTYAIALDSAAVEKVEDLVDSVLEIARFALRVRAIA